MFRSNDGGCTWSPTNASLRSPFVEAVAASPDFANDQTVVAGTTDAGLHISYDGGKRWERRVFWGEHPTVTALGFSSSYADDDTIAAGTEGRGVYISDNLGRSWNGYGPELADAQITALAVAPHSADVMLAGGLTAGSCAASIRRDPGRLEAACPPTPRSWESPWSPAFQDDGLALAGTELHGLYCSHDHGATWTAVDDVPANRPINAVTLLAGAAFAVSGNTLWRSQDGGATWHRLRLRGARRASLLALATAGDGVRAGGAWTAPE